MNTNENSNSSSNPASFLVSAVAGAVLLSAGFFVSWLRRRLLAVSFLAI